MTTDSNKCKNSQDDTHDLFFKIKNKNDRTNHRSTFTGYAFFKSLCRRKLNLTVLGKWSSSAPQLHDELRRNAKKKSWIDILSNLQNGGCKSKIKQSIGRNCSNTYYWNVKHYSSLHTYFQQSTSHATIDRVTWIYHLFCSRARVDMVMCQG